MLDGRPDRVGPLLLEGGWPVDTPWADSAEFYFTLIFAAIALIELAVGPRYWKMRTWTRRARLVTPPANKA